VRAAVGLDHAEAARDRFDAQAVAAIEAAGLGETRDAPPRRQCYAAAAASVRNCPLLTRLPYYGWGRFDGSVRLVATEMGDRLARGV
jgi:hypothetical protein